MKSTSKLVLATLAFGAIALTTGCEVVPSDTDPLYSRNNQGFNALGLVDWSPASYQEVAQESAVMYTDQAMDRKNITGNNLSLFWGTFVIADY